jgi:hypothetical protein
MNFIRDEHGNIHMAGKLVGRDFNGDILADEAIQNMEALMTNLTAFNYTGCVKDFIQTASTPDWIRQFQNKENTMEPDNLAKHRESVRMAGKTVNKMKIVTSGVDIQDAINNAYMQLEGIARSFGAHMPSNHQVSMKTTANEAPVKPEIGNFVGPEDYYLAMNKYYRDMGEIHMIGMKVSDDPMAYSQPTLQWDVNEILPGFGETTNGTSWQVSGGVTSTTTTHWPPLQTVITNGTAQYPLMNMFPRREQQGNVGFYDILENMPSSIGPETLKSSSGIPAQIQWYPNPNDLQPDKTKTEPLVEKYAAWHWLEQGKMCTNGHYDLHPTNIDTLHAYNSDTGARVFLSTQADKRDRHRELKEFSYELQDISVVEKDYMALDNPEWTEIS